MTTVFCLLQCTANYYSQTKWFRNRPRFLDWGKKRNTLWKLCICPLGTPPPSCKVLPINPQNRIWFNSGANVCLLLKLAHRKKDASCLGAKKGGGRKRGVKSRGQIKKYVHVYLCILYFGSNCFKDYLFLFSPFI